MPGSRSSQGAGAWLDAPQDALHVLRKAADAIVRKSVSLGVGLPGGAPTDWRDAGLRGPVGADRPRPNRSSGAGSRLDYMIDLTDPKIAGTITTPAGNGLAYIDEYPATNLGVRMSYEDLRDGMRAFADGQRINASASGPRITFVNDNPRNPTPRQPVTTETAGMVTAAILDSGVRSANINSTTGGHAHNPNSRHVQGRAVDINRVNGLPVGTTSAPNSDPRAIEASRALQAAYRRQPNIRENFGPSFQEKTLSGGRRPVPMPSQEPGHRNHLHASGQR